MKHLHRDLDLLKREILAMGSLVEEATRLALHSFIERRDDLAEEVIRGDDAIDQKELEVEEECLKILALHQPVAADLRFIVAVLKVNNDLERIADIAKNIAKRARSLGRAQAAAPPPELQMQAERVRGMVTRSLDSLVKLDSEEARAVCRDDDAVDKIHKKIFTALHDGMVANPENVPSHLDWLSVSRSLERIADLATNVAEDVVFMVEGEIIRHGGMDDASASGTHLKVVPDK